MGVKLVSSGGGSVEINPPATASNFTATMPAGTGTVVVNGVGGTLVSGTAVASTSGTSIDFTGIPSWVKRITVMFSGLSTNSTAVPIVQLGDAGGIETTGYASGSAYTGTGTNQASSTAGFIIFAAAAAGDVMHGICTIALVGSNLWVASASGGLSTAYGFVGGGSKTLSDTLTSIRVTTVAGTATFDAGTINIMYE